MSYLNPEPYISSPYENRFKELCASMPLFYLDVYEMREILKAQGKLADGMFEETERVIRNNFILLADEGTVSKWEAMLEVTYEQRMTLDQRKNVLIGLICGYDHIGEPEIREIISLYTDFDVAISFYRGSINITIDGIGCISGYTNLIETLRKRIPTHLRLGFTINIRSPTPVCIHVGGGSGANTTLGVREAPDVFHFRSAIYPAEAMGAQGNLGVTESRDEFDFRSALYPAEAMGARSTLGVREQPDVFRFSGEVLAGAAENGTRTLLTVPEDTKAPHRVSILRTGGSFVMTAPPIFPTEEG